MGGRRLNEGSQKYKLPVVSPGDVMYNMLNIINTIVYYIWYVTYVCYICYKGKKQIYTHLNAEFQRIARKDKKPFLSDQCKEIEENNRMGKTRDLLKKIRETKETVHAKMGSIKDRNGMDLTEAEDIKKRWQEYTKELYKKDLHDPDKHDGVITHLEPDILECEVTWALRSITTS